MRAWAALWANEWEKIWARRGRLLVGGVLLLVGLTVAGSWHNQKVQQHMAAMAVAQAQEEERALAAAAAKGQSPPPGPSPADLKAALAQEDGYGVAAQVRQYRALLATTPPAGRPALRETIALDRYRLAHGITRVVPWQEGAWRLTGQVFAGGGVFAYALLALVVAADLVAGEVQDGTLSFLFLHGQRRSLIWTAKLGAALATVWVLALGGALTTWLAAFLVLGPGSPWAPHVVGARFQAVAHTPVPQVQVTGHVFPILPQTSYDLWAVVLALAGLGAWTVLAVALSRFTRSSLATFAIGGAGLFTAGLARLLGPAALWDPLVHLAPMADWNGTTALNWATTGAGLGFGLLVLGIWAVAAVGYGLLTFRWMEP